MVLFKINRLYDEIQRVYNEHYKDCKHQEVHDFYRAVMKRMRTTYQNDYVVIAPVVQRRECTHYNGHRHCDYFCEAVLDDDFCSYGQARETPINSAPLIQEERWLKTI